MRLCGYIGVSISLLLTDALFAADPVDVFDYAEPAEVVKTFKYTSTASGAQPWVMNGIIVESPGADEVVNQQTWRVRLQKSQGIDGYAPTDNRVFYREQDDGLYSGFFDGTGQFTEHLQLPVDIATGSSWQGTSPFWDSETLTGIHSFQSAAGTYQHCLYINRQRAIAGPPAQLMQATAVYCPEVGHVRTRTDHAMDGFQSVTETELIAIE